MVMVVVLYSRNGAEECVVVYRTGRMRSGGGLLAIGYRIFGWVSQWGSEPSWVAAAREPCVWED